MKMRSRRIHFWHGRDKKLEAKIKTICRYDSDKDEYYWDGSLQVFEENYEDIFIVYPDMLCVTQFGSWGPR